MHNSQRQSGFVAILTVIFFTLLMSVIAVGFLRLTLQERNQTLLDDLSKGAYQSAQAGVEDAKRAILYCDSLAAGPAKTTCEDALYTATCPGFNSSAYFHARIGIPMAAAGSGTQIGDAAVKQGYSCVIITRNSSSLRGKLALNTSSDSTIYELKTTSPTSRIRVAWHNLANDGQPYVPASGTFVNGAGNAGNPRLPDWPKGPLGESAPAMLRLKTISLPSPTSFMTTNIKTADYFVYPSGVGVAPASATNNLAVQRLETRCDPASTIGGFVCAVDLTFVDAGNVLLTATSGRYLVLQAMYQNAEYEVTAYNGASVTPVSFDGVQPTIDATGYNNGVFRRVKTGVRLGGNSLVTNAALDTGLGICKDFRVGLDVGAFTNDC